MRKVTPREQGADFGVFKIDGERCRLIALNRGMWTIVSEGDYEMLSRYRWYASKMGSHRYHYVARHGGKEDDTCTVFMHRQILGLRKGSKLTGDHCVPMETLDNRRGNLRVATSAQQAHNHHRSINNTTGFKGVCIDSQGKRFRAQMLVNGKRKVLAVGHDPAALHEIYKLAVEKHRGEFGRSA